MKKIFTGFIMAVMLGVLAAVSLPAFSGGAVTANNLFGGYIAPEQDITAVSGTAVANGSYTWVNTSAAAIAVTLPASSTGAIATFGDYAKTFNTHNMTVNAPTGVPIDGVSGSPASAVISTAGAMVRCVFLDNTEGYRCHTY